LNVAVDLSQLVNVQRRGRWAVDHGAGRDVEPGAVALAQECRPRELASREGAWFVGAGAEVVEGVEATLDSSDRDTELSIGQVVGNDAVIGDGIARQERAEGIGSEVGHRVLLVISWTVSPMPAVRT
jgi:hypothetical protein